jgi:hypothetical protein
VDGGYCVSVGRLIGWGGEGGGSRRCWAEGGCEGRGGEGRWGKGVIVLYLILYTMVCYPFVPSVLEGGFSTLVRGDGEGGGMDTFRSHD